MRRPHLRSVRARITLVATVAVALVLVLASFALVREQRAVLTESLGEALEGDLEEIVDRVVADRLSSGIEVGVDDDAFAQVVAADGEVVAATDSVDGGDPVASVPAAGEDPEQRTLAVPAVDEASFLVLSARVDGPDGPVSVHVGAPTDDIDESVDALVGSLAVGVPLVVAALGLLVWGLVGRTLRPVEAIRAEVAEITTGRLHRRVPVPATDDEVADLARTVNQTLDRLESGVERQRQFVGDASHELRSPLTRIRSEIEVDLAHPDGADPVATERSVLAEVEGLQRLVEDLLLLARGDAASELADPRPVDLAELVVDEVHRLAPPPTFAVEGVTEGAVEVQGDAGQLGRALRNVLENAHRHAASTVVVDLTLRDGQVVLRVADDGPGIPADQAERVFERFTRLDQARSASDGGTGLGLAIAREVVERHGGHIEVDPTYADGARLVITLPAS